MKKRGHGLAAALVALAAVVMFGGNGVKRLAQRIGTAVTSNGNEIEAPAFAEFRLANGMRFVAVPRPGTRLVAYQTWVHAGSRQEKLDPELKVTGLAHLFEHLMFRGTPTLPDGKFDELMSRLGARGANATTWLDRTNYFAVVPAGNLEAVMSAEADRMVNLVLDDGTLERERGAVLSEYQQGRDNPDTLANELLYAAAFEVHPYRYSTIGTEDEIRGFRLADLKTFYSRYYQPSNATVVAVGDLEPSVFRASVEKIFGGLAARATPRAASPTEPEQRKEKQVRFGHPQLEEEKLLLGYHAPGVTHDDAAALWVLEALLSYGEAAVLNRIWVRPGLAVGAGAEADQFAAPGLFRVSASVQDEAKSDELLNELDQWVGASLPKLGEAEVERAKAQLQLRAFTRIEDCDGLAHFIGEHLVAAGAPMAGFELLKRASRVNADRLKRVASRVLRPESRTVVIGSPAGGG